MIEILKRKMKNVFNEFESEVSCWADVFIKKNFKCENDGIIIISEIFEELFVTNIDQRHANAIDNLKPHNSEEMIVDDCNKYI